MSAAIADSDTIRVSRTARLRGTISVPGDKSIAHRALLFGAIANGWTRIVGLPRNADVGATIDALIACGVLIQRNAEAAVVQGCGFDALARHFTSNGKHPFEIDCANSGTTMRLLSGILAGANVEAVLTGDASLTKRPMKRITEPLTQMGASIAPSENGTAPLRIGARRLHGIDYELQVASAQIKSAVILAGLFAEGTTRISGKIVSRDHTERLLPVFGGTLSIDDAIVVRGGQSLRGAFVRVPGDPSSAAFWIAAAAIVPDADVVVHGVGANPSRMAFITIVQRMGAQITIESQSTFPEPIATLRARSSRLRGIELGGNEVAMAIDELPLVAVLATQAEGVTVVRDARELRVKESDRIESVAAMLRALGGKIETFDDGFAIEGPQQLHAGRIDPRGDHRIAMAGTIAALVAEGESHVADPGAAAVSYPAFFATLAQLGGEVA